jgi:hypothetical protein
MHLNRINVTIYNCPITIVEKEEEKKKKKKRGTKFKVK